MANPFGTEALSTDITHIGGVGDNPATSNETQSVVAQRIHLCDECGAFNPTFCAVDCNGNYFGTALRYWTIAATARVD